MSLPRAAAYLWVASFRNRIDRQWARLKKPQYLLGTLVGALYFWNFFVRRWASFQSGRGAAMGPSLQRGLELGFSALAVLFVAGAWVFGSERSALAFSEAEVQFLFTAPLTRRQLLHFKLSRSLLRILLSGVFSTLFVGFRMSARPGFFFLGSWFALSSLSLHLMAASLTRESLAQHGAFGWRRRRLTLIGIALVLGAMVYWTISGKPPAPEKPQLLLEWVESLADAPPLAWLLFPIRAPIRMALAQTAGQFLASLPTAVLVLVAHYVWVLSSDVAFEESAVAASASRAQRLDARRSGRSRAAISGAARAFRPRLSGVGAAEVALIWKNVIAARRIAAPLVIPSLLILTTTTGFVLWQFADHGTGGIAALTGALCAATALFLCVLGPSLLRVDLREDLSHLDVLRGLPLTGTQIVRAEVVGSALLLGALQCALLGLSVLLSVRYRVPGFGLVERFGLALSLAFLCPPLTLAGITVQNAAVLLFPAWVVVDRKQARGIEALGQRLLTMAGTLFVLTLVVVPAAAIGGGVAAVLGLVLRLGLYAVPFGACAAGLAILLEVRVALQWLGRLFDSFDVSDGPALTE